MGRKNECTNELNDHLRRASSLLRLTPATRPQQCDHVKTNGEFCGSPALRGRNYCYFHLTHIGRRLRAQRNHARAQAGPPENAVLSLELPPFEDANSVQIALMQVVDAILHNRLDSKRAGLVLYALQTASSNLANGADFQQDADAVVAGRYDEFEEDFELGEDVPELSTDAAQEEIADEEYTATMQVEQILEACATLEEAKKEAEEAGKIETDEEGIETFHCDPISGFFCSIMGHRAQPCASVTQRNEREAASQRLELLPSFSPTPSPSPISRGGSRRRKKNRMAQLEADKKGAAA